MVAPAPAQANPSSGFDPSNIISDANFYHGTAMSAAQIQVFLNQRVPRCTIGDPGRAAGSVWGSTRIASSCLRDARFTTSSRASNAYCRAYQGGANETAAAIIAKVGQSCGISPKVLLVMLEKEQSLVTDTWPTVRQFDVAMGYACPDSGPNNSANCDPSQTGFFQQVYRAAWQLQVYKAHPNSYNYKPFQANRIQWHPNAGCGTSLVTIQNWATAALYIYTPYRPNQAALNAGWGTGDSCSSYGNRNFYNFYKTWFGNTQLPFPVDGGIMSYWQANKSWLGNPAAAAVTVPANGGGRLQRFEGGNVYEPQSGAASGMTASSPILKAFAAAGGIEGSWGWPIAPAINQGASGLTTMRFQGGTVAETRGVGVFIVPESLRAEWEKYGGYSGSIGYPSAAAKTTASGAVAQDFARGTLVSVSGSGARRVDPAFLSAWRAGGGAGSATGVPIADPVVSTANGGGTTYRLQFGTMYRSSTGSATIPAGGFRNAYDAVGGVSGSLGWPKSALDCSLSNSGCTMEFQFGGGVWRPGGTLIRLAPSTFAAWRPLAEELGFPDGPASSVGTGDEAGTIEAFPGGNIYSSRSGAFALLNGPILDGYVAAGGPSQAWGWPAGAHVCNSDGAKCVMPFTGGVASWVSGGGLAFVDGEPGSRNVRISGSDRFETAVAMSQHGYSTSAGTVIVANGLDFPDALSAGALGAKWKAPLLLTRPDTLPAATAAEIERLRPSRIVVIGGTGAVSDAVVAKLEEFSERVDRVSGADRYATSIEIAKAGWANGTASDSFLVTGAGFPDALAAGAAAGKYEGPVLLVPGDAEKASTPIMSELSRLGTTTVHIVGGTGAVSSGIQSAVGQGRAVVRYAGVDRFDTSARIANGIFPDGTRTDTYWASGYSFADALAGGALVGAKGSPLLLTRQECVPGSVAEANARVVGVNTFLLGGSSVLGNEVLAGTRCAR
ncbi:cell wall-binding repeat-containing protein [Leucobacter triazinivorans]|nr:cell wall-binding repeat-containing protein [Leucobacter triazinivorans]